MCFTLCADRARERGLRARGFGYIVRARHTTGHDNNSPLTHSFKLRPDLSLSLPRLADLARTTVHEKIENSFLLHVQCAKLQSEQRMRLWIIGNVVDDYGGELVSFVCWSLKNVVKNRLRVQSGQSQHSFTRACLNADDDYEQKKEKYFYHSLELDQRNVRKETK